MFKTSAGILKLSVTSYSMAGPEEWSENAPNNKLGIYFTIVADLSEFEDVSIDKIRIPFNSGYIDLDIKDKESQKIQKMISLIQTD